MDLLKLEVQQMRPLCRFANHIVNIFCISTGFLSVGSFSY